MGSGQCEAGLCLELACSFAGIGNNKHIQLPGSTVPSRTGHPEASLVLVTSVACIESGVLVSRTRQQL